MGDWSAKEYQSYIARFEGVLNRTLLKKEHTTAAANLASAELLSQQIQEMTETIGKCSELLEGIQDILFDASSIMSVKRPSSLTKLKRPVGHPADPDACA